MKFWNLKVSGDGESKALDIEVYGVIDPDMWEGLPGGITAKEIAAQLQEHADAKTVTVHINSIGGDVFGGIAMYSLLRSHPAAKAGNLRSVVEGLAASAASLVAMAGKTVMGPGSMLMVHNPWTLAAGEAKDLRKTADTLDQIRDSLIAIYQQKTGKKAAELRAMLDEESWLTAAQAKAQGFADEVEGPTVQPKAEGDNLVFNAVAFPRASVPARVYAALLATGTTEPTPAPPAAESEAPLDPGPAAAPGPDPAAAPEAPAAPEPPAAAPQASAAAPPRLTRALLAAQAPEILAEILAEGAAGERERIQAIDELELAAEFPDLVRAAKYGDKPGNAAELAIAAVKAQKDRGHSILALRRAESGAAAAVTPSAPQRDKTTEERDAASDIAARANARR